MLTYMLDGRGILSTLSVAILIKVATASNENHAVEKIKELEREKQELYKKIIEGIDDSEKTLKKSNDTEALLGLKYVKDLKEHLLRENVEQQEVREGNETNTSNRRFVKHKKKKNDPFDFESVLKPKKGSAKEWKRIMEDRVRMQKQIDKWIEEREKGKKRQEEHRQYKKTGRFEKCPRFGYKGKNKKATKDKKKIVDCKEMVTSSDYDEHFEECVNRTRARSEAAARRKYPCCRKCCKKSYMGCL